MLRKIGNHFLKHPFAAGSLAGSLTFLYQSQSSDFTKEFILNDSISEKLKYLAPSLVALYGLPFVLTIIKHYVIADPKATEGIVNRKRLAKVSELISALNSEPVPQMRSVRTKTSFSFIDEVKSIFDVMTASEESAKQKLKKEQTPNLLFNAMVERLWSNKLDDAMDFMRLATDRLGNSSSVIDTTGSYYWFAIAASGWFVRLIKPHEAQSYLFSSCYSALTNPQKAWYFSQLGKRVADAFNSPFRKEMYVFDGLLASAQGRSDEERVWKEAIALVRQDAQWERLGETRTIVRRLANSPFFANTFVFKERQDLESLAREKDACDKLAEIIPDATVPKPLYLTKEPENGLHYLVLRYLPGETLQVQLERGEKSAVPRVIQTLAKIHAHFPADHLPRVNLEDRIEKLAIPECAPEVKAQIRSNYAPIINAVETVPWVWNKDAHPENWQIGDKIGVLDCEGDLRVPATFDLANLLEYDDSLTRRERQKYIVNYRCALSEEGKLFAGDYAVAYHNSVIHRMLAFANAWSAPERQSMHSKRSAAIQRGLNAIANLEEECTSYFAKYFQQYRRLTNALSQLKSALPTGQLPS